jgi:hypothetical protein
MEGIHHAGTLPFNTDHHKVDATLPKKKNRQRNNGAQKTTSKND